MMVLIHPDSDNTISKFALGLYRADTSCSQLLSKIQSGVPLGLGSHGTEHLTVWLGCLQKMGCITPDSSNPSGFTLNSPLEAMDSWAS